MLKNDLAVSLAPEVFAFDRLGFRPDPWQQKVLRWTGRRLLLNCSRQVGKSSVTAILALHRVLYYPNSLILLISPSLRQSAELFQKICSFLNCLEVRPDVLELSKLALRLPNGSRIVSLPSAEQTIRGYSAVDLVIEDEAARVDDQLYRAIRPVLATSGGRLILLSTPYGQQGHFFEEWASGDSSWERVRVTATECPRISAKFLAEERASLGETFFNREYMCTFSDSIDQVFSYDLIEAAISFDVKPLF